MRERKRSPVAGAEDLALWEAVMKGMPNLIR